MGAIGDDTIDELELVFGSSSVFPGKIQINTNAQGKVAVVQHFGTRRATFSYKITPAHFDELLGYAQSIRDELPSVPELSRLPGDVLCHLACTSAPNDPGSGNHRTNWEHRFWNGDRFRVAAVAALMTAHEELVAAATNGSIVL